METFALLQASIVAVSSESRSLVSGNPAEKRINIFRPGTARRFFARLRTASSMVRAPKSASSVLIEDIPEEAIMTGRASLDLVRSRHGGVVEKKNHVVLLRADGSGRIVAEGKAGDSLLLVVLVDLEILLGEAVDVVPFLVGHHRI